MESAPVIYDVKRQEALRFGNVLLPIPNRTGHLSCLRHPDTVPVSGPPRHTMTDMGE